MIPFIGTEARRAGMVNRYQLATRYYPVFRDVCVPQGHELTAVDKALAAWLWSGRQATVVGLSAAALHGSLWIDSSLPAELNQRSQHKTEGILLHNDSLADDESCAINDVMLTTPQRTAFDIGRREGLTTAVIRVDALMRATQLTPIDVHPLVERHRGARGVVLLRRVLSLADPGAESPQETRTRLLLVLSGLPRPRTQIRVFDGGYLIARLDMGWEEWRVGIEFDGAQHWTDPRQHSRDIDRIAELEALDWTIVRVSAEMLRNRPSTIVERTRAALSRAGCPRV